MKILNESTKMDLPLLFFRHAEIFVCPYCQGSFNPVESSGAILICSRCDRHFGSENGIPLLFCPHQPEGDKDVTSVVRAFYEENPFPHYDDFDTGATLRQKAEKGVFARQLDYEIPPGALILEAGCGTGQLSNFLGLTAGRSVFGTDICLNSLKLARGFKEKNHIANVDFFQMNIFRPIFKPESFHFVVSNGVLHSTGDPFLGFQTLVKLVKKGGFIMIGLYHAYGRIWTDLRRLLYRYTRDHFKFLDARLRMKSLSAAKKRSWFMDQYRHPLEFKYTLEEILRWFDQARVEFIHSIPSCRLTASDSLEGRLFQKKSRGSAFERLWVDWGMIFRPQEGGFFIMIGRKK